MAKTEGTPNVRERYELPRGIALTLLWPNFLAKTLYLLALVVGSLSRIGVQPRLPIGLREGRLAIEAGEVAWEHIFFTEAFQSAKEFLGDDQVVKLAIKPDQTYVRQVSDLVTKHPITHYFYDPRTGSQKLVPALFQSFQLVAIFSRRGIVPIAYCTDISLRRWRFQVAIVSALNGVCVCLTRDDIAKRMFPHDRLIGPALMPLSQKTLAYLDKLRQKKSKSSPLKVSFFGSLYVPRVSQLEEIRKGLEEAGIDFQVRGRVPGGERISDEDYWKEIISADILVSTSSQVDIPGMDLGHVNHLIYRFTEALACGVCLVIEDAPGVEKYFADTKDLVLWQDSKRAIDAIVQLSANGDRIARIGRDGKTRVSKLIQTHVFWVELEKLLRSSPLSSVAR